jgi:aspartate aminotransferase
MNDKNEELEGLRREIRSITTDIILRVQKRMELSKQIGKIKAQMNMNVMDEKVEQEVRNSILESSKEVGMDPDFCGRLLNILLIESVRVQKNQQQFKDVAHRQTHMNIFTKAKQIEASGKNIIHMEIGEPDYPAPQNVKRVLSESYDLRHYHYTETTGIKELRHAIANKVGNHVAADQVMITVGARFAVFSAIVSLLKAGDELISIEPAWPAYKECVNFIGAKNKVIETTLEENWRPNITQFEEIISANTKMIVLNYPNNPTGKILDDNTLNKIIQFAKDHDLYILSDEVYSDYAFNGFKSILEYNYDKGIMISSFSKGYAMTGFRVGYAIAKDDIIAQMAKIQATALTSVAEPMQYSALAALEESPAENVKRIKKRLDIVSDKLRKMSIPFTVPDGAMYVYPKLKNGVDDITIVDRLLNLGVAVAPGSAFGDAYKQYIRISACQPENNLEKGLNLLNITI